MGLKADVKSNVHYAEETQIIYPAGTNTILWLADQKTQKFFQGNEGAEGITCLAVNSTKRYLAVAEKCYEGAIVTVFDLVTTKKRKTLSVSTLQDCDCPEFVCVAFSSDNKFLLTQCGSSPSGKHSWTLVYWMWDKARPMAALKVSNAQDAPIRECSFNPSDSGIVCVLGDGVFKFLHLKEGGLKPPALAPTNPPKLQSFLCHTWLSDERMMMCCENGELMLVDSSGEFQAILPGSPGEPRSATCILSFSKGFITGGDDGYIRIYEKSDDPKELYRKTKTIPLDNKSSTAVRSLALSPSEETLAVTTSTAQLCQMSLQGGDLLKAEDAPVFEPVLDWFHSGAIWGMDVCTRKPLVVTCGVDKSVRVWNYIDKKLELCKFFNEEAYSVAFHPSGFHLIIGFSDKLRLMNLLMEDMRMYKDIPIKQCRECRFSNGGQYFAAVSANFIHVYKTYTCELIETLRGHNGKVRSVAWTADDSMLVSTGMDGAVYEYNVLRAIRAGNDFVLKGTGFSCVIVYTDPSTGGNTMYAVGNDKSLREVCNGQEQRKVEAGTTLGQIVLSNSAKALFAAVAEPDAPAAIRCYKFPFTNDGQCVTFQAHSLPATRIRITFDDFYLFSCSEDGCLFIFDVRKKDNVRSKREKENVLPHADEILVTRTFLEEKQAALLELETQVEELSNQIDFQIRHRDTYHKEEMVELEEKYTHEIEQERMKYELLREEKNDAEMESEESMKSLVELHAKQTQELEASFQHKMMIEVDRYQKLAAEREKAHASWQKEFTEMMEDHKRKVEKFQDEFQDTQGKEKHAIERIKEEKTLAERVHAETMDQLEKDTDQEIEELKEEKETALKKENAKKVELRGKSGIHKRESEEAKKDMMKLDDRLRGLQEEARKKQEKIEQLKEENARDTAEIDKRELIIEQREQKIYALKKQNQELEKFKFVLDYKIKELKMQIEPRNAQIAEMNRQIHEMDEELEEYHKKNKQLQVNIEQLQNKQRTLQEEVVTQRKKMSDCHTIIKRFKTDLHECVEFIQEPKQLRDHLTNLYKKYVPKGVQKHELDSDIQREYNRQRDYLQKSVESLKRKLLKDSDVHRRDNTCALQENVALIREINELRRDIDCLKRERQQQRLNVSKLKGGGNSSTTSPTAGASGKSITNKPSPSSGSAGFGATDDGASAEAVREMEANRAKIEDLRRQVDEQRRMRQSSAQG
jgi:WD40 repeat protein